MSQKQRIVAPGFVLDIENRLTEAEADITESVETGVWLVSGFSNIKHVTPDTGLYMVIGCRDAESAVKRALLSAKSDPSDADVVTGGRIVCWAAYPLKDATDCPNITDMEEPDDELGDLFHDEYVRVLL